MRPFSPIGATVSRTATTTSGRSTLTATGDGPKDVRVYNAGTATVFVTFGDSTVEATTAAGLPIPSGYAEVFHVGSCTHMASITAADTAVTYATSGKGL